MPALKTDVVHTCWCKLAWLGLQGLVSKHTADIHSGRFRVAAPHSHAEEIREILYTLLHQQRAQAERVLTAAS